MVHGYWIMVRDATAFGGSQVILLANSESSAAMSDKLQFVAVSAANYLRKPTTN